MMRRLGKTTDRGYGAAHQRARDGYRPTVEAGDAHCMELRCLLPTRWIAPGTPWDLAHDRRTGGYLGPAHRRCNRAEGARWKQLLRRGFVPVLRTPPASSEERRWRL